MDNFFFKQLHDDWMGNAAGVAKKNLFSVGMGCRLFRRPGINGLDLASLSPSLIISRMGLETV